MFLYDSVIRSYFPSILTRTTYYFICLTWGIYKNTRICSFSCKLLYVWWEPNFLMLLSWSFKHRRQLWQRNLIGDWKHYNSCLYGWCIYFLCLHSAVKLYTFYFLRLENAFIGLKSRNAIMLLSDAPPEPHTMLGNWWSNPYQAMKPEIDEREGQHSHSSPLK